MTLNADADADADADPGTGPALTGTGPEPTSAGPALTGTGPAPMTGPSAPPAGPARPVAAQSGGYRAVFAVREFRAVFAAHVLSLQGTVVAQIALAVLVFRLTASPLLSALTFALGFVPYAISGTLLAGIADRFPPRRILVVCDLLCAACAVGMVLPGTPIAVLLVLRGLMATVGPVFSGTRAASLADILPGDSFVLGRSLIRIVAQGAQVVGFGVGGLLLIVVSPRGALLLTAAAFLGSALLLRLGTRRRPARGDRGRADGGGTGRLLADRRVRSLLLLGWVPPFFAVVPEALAAPYADAAGAGTTGLGLFMAAMPVGMILGESLAGGRLSPAGRGRIAVPLAACTLLPYVVFLLRPSLPWSLAAMFVAGLTCAYTLGVDQWFVDAVPEELRGRAMTVQSAGLMTIQGAGMVAAGAAAEFLPVHLVNGWTGVLGTLCVLVVLRPVRGEPRRHP
ncbi:MFS transporter [Streptomyces sp. NBC_01689]|uniref:MFS transporter n=1 Tax=unclassified Streptomyces TaxID=2593676 RepID=UPI003FCDCC11